MKPDEDEKQYKADFLWPTDEDADYLGHLLYELVNANTEEFRRDICLEIRKLFKQGNYEK